MSKSCPNCGHDEFTVSATVNFEGMPFKQDSEVRYEFTKAENEEIVEEVYNCVDCGQEFGYDELEEVEDSDDSSDDEDEDSSKEEDEDEN